MRAMATVREQPGPGRATTPIDPSPGEVGSGAARPRSPLARALGGWSGALGRVLRRGRGAGTAAAEDRIKDLLREGARPGESESAEHEMARRVFRLGERGGGDLMTPLAEVVWLDVADPPEEMQRKIAESPHSRFPVCEGSIDNILGVVQVKELLVQGFRGQPFGIKGLLKMPLFLYEGSPGLKALEMFKDTGVHVAVVLDEYGSVKGLLTLNDILGAIVGPLPEGEPKAVRRPDGSWLLDGMLGLDEFRDLFAIAALPVGGCRTLAGFVIERLGHIPHAADRLEWGGLRFEIAGMDGYRVDKVLVAPATGAPGTS
jgi:putative hemolysin